MTDVTVSPSSSLSAEGFKEAIREKVLSSFMNLIPKEELDKYIDKEIKAFFESEEIHYIKETTVEIDNPNYNQKNHDPYSYIKPKLQKDAITFGSQMTPFRQLVWTTLHQHMKPVLIDALKDSTNIVSKYIDEEINKTAKPTLDKSLKLNFEALVMKQSALMFNNIYTKSVEMANSNITNIIKNQGITFIHSDEDIYR